MQFYAAGLIPHRTSTDHPRPFRRAREKSTTASGRGTLRFCRTGTWGGRPESLRPAIDRTTTLGKTSGVGEAEEESLLLRLQKGARWAGWTAHRRGQRGTGRLQGRAGFTTRSSLWAGCCKTAVRCDSLNRDPGVGKCRYHIGLQERLEQPHHPGELLGNRETGPDHPGSCRQSQKVV